MLLHSCVSGKLRINPSNLKCSSQYAPRVYGLASFPDPCLRNGGGCWGSYASSCWPEAPGARGAAKGSAHPHADPTLLTAHLETAP